MLKIEYNHTNYSDLLAFFATQFQATIVDNTLNLPAWLGEGYLKLIELPNGLQGIVSDYVVHKDMLLTRTKINADYFTLRFDEVYLPETESTTPEDQLPTEANITRSRSAVFLGSAKFDWIYYSVKGTRIKGVNIFFSKSWLEHFLEAESVGDQIKKYLSLKMSAFNYEPMDKEYKRILAEIVNADVNASFKSLVMQNRVMLLLERFFTRTYHRMTDMHFNIKISNDDIDRIKEIERELVKDFSIEPPGIAKLAKKAAMSPSKLKNSFKEIHGLPIYQYFQKHRMNKAKAMLLSKKYSVREVGVELGYSNLSNFAKAFKKSFDQLPSDLLGSGKLK